MLKTLVKKIKKSKGGFTLIELIVVVCILAILAAILIPAIGGQIAKSRASSLQSDAQSIYTALVTANDDYTSASQTAIAGTYTIASPLAKLTVNSVPTEYWSVGPATGTTPTAWQTDVSTIATNAGTTQAGFKWKDGNIAFVGCTIDNGTITQVEVTGTDGNFYTYPQK